MEKQRNYQHHDTECQDSHFIKLDPIKNDLGPNADEDDKTKDIMKFIVNKPLSGKDTSKIPKVLSHIPSLKENNITTIRNLKLVG